MKILLVLPAIAALASALVLLVAGCGREPAGSRQVVTVAATTTQVADLARNVAGDRAEVIGILPPNADPHDYEPRPSDVEAIGRADVVLKSGGDLDLWADALIDSAGGDRAIDTMSDQLATVRREGGEADPHWWQDPRNAEAAVRRIRDRLIELDPGGRSAYEQSAESYLTRLKRLDQGIAACLRGVPSAQRKLVTTHDALGYYADRYGIEVIGAAIPALTTQAQPSAGETAELVDQIKSERVKAIFPETGLNPKLEQAIAGETGATVGGQLWADTLGPPESSGATYLDAMASNTETLVDGFTGGRESCRPPG